MIKFLFKMIIVFIVALAAVIYHNTEAGRDMERRIGKEMSLDRLAERGEMLLDRTIYFLSLKGLEYKSKSEEALKKSLKDTSGGGKVEKPGKKANTPPFKPDNKKNEEVEMVKKEGIKEEDRKKLLQIIEDE